MSVGLGRGGFSPAWRRERGDRPEGWRPGQGACTGPRRCPLRGPHRLAYATQEHASTTLEQLRGCEGTAPESRSPDGAVGGTDARTRGPVLTKEGDEDATRGAGVGATHNSGQGVPSKHTTLVPLLPKRERKEPHSCVPQQFQIKLGV